MTDLISASYKGHTEIVSLLLDRGVDVNMMNNYGDTAIVLASSEGHTEIVSLLLDRGADINIRDNGGETVLDRAANDDYLPDADDLKYCICMAYHNRRHVKP